MMKKGIVQMLIWLAAVMLLTACGTADTNETAQDSVSGMGSGSENAVSQDAVSGNMSEGSGESGNEMGDGSSADTSSAEESAVNPADSWWPAELLEKRETEILTQICSTDAIPEEVINASEYVFDHDMGNGDLLVYCAVFKERRGGEFTLWTDYDIQIYREGSSVPLQTLSVNTGEGEFDHIFDFKDINADGLDDLIITTFMAVTNKSTTDFIWSPSREQFVLFETDHYSLSGTNLLTRRYYTHTHASAWSGEENTYQWIGETESELIRTFSNYDVSGEAAVRASIWIKDAPDGALSLDHDYSREEYDQRRDDISDIYFCTDLLWMGGYRTPSDGTAYRVIYGQDRWNDPDNAPDRIFYQDHIYVYDGTNYLEYHMGCGADSPVKDIIWNSTAGRLTVRYENGASKSYIIQEYDFYSKREAAYAALCDELRSGRYFGYYIRDINGDGLIDLCVDRSREIEIYSCENGTVVLKATLPGGCGIYGNWRGIAPDKERRREFILYGEDWTEREFIWVDVNNDRRMNFPLSAEDEDMDQFYLDGRRLSYDDLQEMRREFSQTRYYALWEAEWK